MAAIFSHNETNVLMSPATAAHYGEWADEFPIWAETQNMQNVVVVTPEDILQGRDPQSLTREEKQEALTQFIEENFPDFPLEEFADETMSLGGNAVSGAGRAESRDLDGDGVQDVGIVIGPSRSRTNIEAAAGLGGLEPSQVSNVRGTDLEWQVKTIAHEIGHLDQADKSRGMNLVWEVEAEQNMINFLQAAHEKGMLSDPGIMDDITSVRSLKGFFFKSDMQTHDVGPAVRTPSESNAPVATEDLELATPMHEVKMRVAYEVGQGLITDTHKRDAIREMWAGDGVYSFDDRKLLELTRDDRKIMIDMFEGEISIEQGLEQLPENISNKILENFESETRVVGIGALRDDPALMYETSRRMYQDGAFDDLPIGKQFAYEALSAAQKFAPEYFGVADRNETFEPPVFEQSDQTTPINHTTDRSHTLITSP